MEEIDIPIFRKFLHDDILYVLSAMEHSMLCTCNENHELPDILAGIWTVTYIKQNIL